jgi:PEP-CTERM motif
MKRNFVAALKTALFGVAAVAFMAVPASAVPTPGHGLPFTSVDPTLDPFSVDGHLQVVFTFSDASNEDVILTIPTLGPNPILDNHSTAVGAVVDLGNFTGNLTFELHNLFTNATYFSDSLDSFGDYHVVLDSNYADFGVGPLDATALANINALANQGYSIVFMAWEDHDVQSYHPSDWDYNDVIYALAYKVNTHSLVPEPLTLSLFGAGLAGAAALRRRRKASKNA